MADVPPGVKGMNDILPPEVSKWQFLEQQARDVLEAFAYRELRTPVLEYTPLFVRSVGEVTDVVEKQMYTFDDRDGRSVSLRPEGTASAVRAYIETRAVEQGAGHPLVLHRARCSGTSAPSAAACASSTRSAPRCSARPSRRSTPR